MNQLEIQLKNEAAQLRLSPMEKNRLRAALQQAMAAGAPAVISPYQRIAPWFMHHGRFIATSVSALLIIVIMGGTAYAAESSLPGNPLYAIKIHVNEEVKVALATTPAAKVAINASLAQKRVAEAETLAARGELDVNTTEQIQNNFDVHAVEALAYAQEAQPEIAASEKKDSAAKQAIQIQATTSAVMAPQPMTLMYAVAPTTPATTTATTTPTTASIKAAVSTVATTTLKIHLTQSLDAERAILSNLKAQAELRQSKHQQRPPSVNDTQETATSSKKSEDTQASSTVSATTRLLHTEETLYSSTNEKASLKADNNGSSTSDAQPETHSFIKQLLQAVQ